MKYKRPPSEKPAKARPFVFVGRWRSEDMPRWVCRCKTLEDAKGEAQTFFRNHTTGSLKGGLLHELDGTTHVFYANGDYFCTIPPLSSFDT